MTITKEIDDGGSAYPLHPGILPEWKGQTGMSLRQHYAGLALSGLLPAYATAYGNIIQISEIASEAVKIADELLLALKANDIPVNAAPDLLELAKSYEVWEADVILNGDWAGETVRLTQDQFDGLIALQTKVTSDRPAEAVERLCCERVYKAEVTKAEWLTDYRTPGCSMENAFRPHYEFTALGGNKYRYVVRLLYAD